MRPKELTPPHFWAANCIVPRTHLASMASERGISWLFKPVWVKVFCYSQLKESSLLQKSILDTRTRWERMACSSVWLQGKLYGKEERRGLTTERPVGPGHDKIVPWGFQDFILRAVGSWPRVFNSEVMCSNLYCRKITLIGKNNLQEGER